MTTRRCFIGPIPEGWLKSHRKHWIKDHLHVNYSSRAATFHASDQISEQRRVTGLDGRSSQERIKPSFAQPADIQVERPEENGEERLSGPSHMTSSAASDRSTALLVPKDPHVAPSTAPEPVQTDGEEIADARQPITPVPHVLFDLPRVTTRDQLRKRARQIQADIGRGTARALRRSEATGQVIKIEKMLVRVDHTPETKLPDDYDENGSQTIVSSTTDPWREYVVVCRHASVAEDGKFALQFYNTRVIPAIDKSTEQKRASYTIALSKSGCGVNLYSSLDKTVAVWRPAKKGTRIFILRPKSNADAAEWYTFLRDILGIHRSTELQVNVPDLDVQLRLEQPLKQFEMQQKAYHDSDEAHEEDIASQGHLIATSIIERCVEMLEEVPEYKGLVADWIAHNRVGLAWKRYDRLEWIHGHAERKMYGTMAMSRSHELELRPKQHYPTTARSKKGHKLEEPPAVEGFLIRLTSQKGHHQRMGRLFFKRLYFSTHDHYLVFSKPGQAIPPPPPRLPTAGNGTLPSAHEISEQVPIIYSVNPYPLEGKGITWLKDRPGNTLQNREHHDHEAYEEIIRKASLIHDCDGFIDLCQVRKVRLMKLGETPVDDELSDGSDVDFDATGDASAANEGGTDEVDFKRTLELVLNNGLIIRLQAFNKETKLEWMKRLSALVKYWKARHTQDTELFKGIRKQNLDALHIDEETEAVVGQFARKWEVTQTHASPLLYNMCGISRCRTIHMSGPLYYKPQRRALFKNINAILISGRLVMYSSQARSATGQIVRHIHQNKIDSIDLTGCYLYSGLLTQNDLLYTNQTFDATNPGHHALPRIWRDEGWTSRDEDYMTCFVIWQSTSKSWFRREKSAMNQDDKKSRFARVSQLGTTGRSIVFKARSRVERDHWVLAIATEIERLQKSDDVRITLEESSGNST